MPGDLVDSFTPSAVALRKMLVFMIASTNTARRTSLIDWLCSSRTIMTASLTRGLDSENICTKLSIMSCIAVSDTWRTLCIFKNKEAKLFFFPAELLSHLCCSYFPKDLCQEVSRSVRGTALNISYLGSVRLWIGGLSVSVKKISFIKSETFRPESFLLLWALKEEYTFVR